MLQVHIRMEHKKLFVNQLVIIINIFLIQNNNLMYIIVQYNVQKINLIQMKINSVNHNVP